MAAINQRLKAVTQSLLERERFVFSLSTAVLDHAQLAIQDCLTSQQIRDRIEFILQDISGVLEHAKGRLPEIAAEAISDVRRESSCN